MVTLGLNWLSGAGGSLLGCRNSFISWSRGGSPCARESRSVVSDSFRSYGLYSPWNSPDQPTGVGSLSLLQGGSSQPRDWTQVSCIGGGFLPAEPQGKPKKAGMDLPNLGIELGSPALQADSLPTELSGVHTYVKWLHKNPALWPGAILQKSLSWNVVWSPPACYEHKLWRRHPLQGTEWVHIKGRPKLSDVIKARWENTAQPFIPS